MIVASRIFKTHAALLALALSFILGSVRPAGAQQASGQPALEVFGTGTRNTFPIAIPDFVASGAPLAKPSLSEIVQNDLKLSGYFRAPDNPQFVRETQAQDAAKNAINFAEWKRIGALYLAKGTYTIQGNELVTEVKVYDTAGAKYVFGKRYENYSVGEARQLAHRISDDILERIMNVPGIAGTKLTYVRSNDRYGKSKQICTMDADGNGARAITAGDELCATPCWGARGTEIYYTTYRDYNPDLRGIILRSSSQWWISRRAGFNLSPDWSEKQRLITLSMTKDGNSEIYTINREGKELRRMTINRGIDSSPCWSPDGSQIAFTSDRSGSPQIWVMDARTLDAHRVTFQGTYNDGPTWAMDNRIAYSSRIDGVFQICSINVDGTDIKQLTTGSSNSEDPTWAPNGKVLAFTSDRSGSNQIYSMADDGSNQTQLSHGSPSQSAQWSKFVQ